MTTDEKYILTIDLGTSGPKLALFTTSGKLIDHEFERVELLLFPNGGAEQRPEDWWTSIKLAAHRLLNKVNFSADKIVAICCTSQWSGTVAVDKSGKALMNAIIWMDARGAPYVRKIAGGIINFEKYDVAKLATWIHLTGGVPSNSGKDPVGHILYIKNECPKVYKKTHKFLEPRDYLNLRLTGKFASSYETITLHWVTDNRSINNIDYSPQLLKITTLKRKKLPDLYSSIDVLGRILPDVAKELGLPEHVKVVMGTPDVQSAAIGSGAVRDYEPHLYIGTSSWLTCHVPFKKTDLLHNMATLPSAIPGKYFIANEQETAGACLNFLKNSLFFPEDELDNSPAPEDFYKKIDLLAALSPPGSRGVIFTPWLNGERSPMDDHHLKGGFFNLALDSKRCDMVRAVLEGVALNARWLLQYVEKMVKKEFQAVNFIGGGAQSPFWCQLIANVFDRPIRQVKDPIVANSRGAAYLAAVALGHLTFDEIAEKIEIEQIYTPNPHYRKLYSNLFKEFVAIYTQNKAMYKRLNG